jgi:hypothetical protein
MAAPRFQSALKKLATSGSAALKPQLVASADGVGAAGSHWKPPLISSRVASLLRKQSIHEGTYGSFDAETLKGWDAQWDLDLATSRSQGSGRLKLRPPNKTSRQRTREKRATKIDTTMLDMKERIEAHYQEKRNAKPPTTFESRYKQQMVVKR